MTKPNTTKSGRSRSCAIHSHAGNRLQSGRNEPAAASAGIGEVSVESAAEMLIAGGSTRAIFVSPEGDEGAAAAVMVAREVADAGLRVLLLDLTASGAASRPMLDSVSKPGITNLLVSEAQFTDAIHTDHYSDCHVMPVGTADPVRAMKAADRLPVIMQSLTAAYDVVVVECGASDAEGHPPAGRGRHRDNGQRDRAGRRDGGHCGGAQGARLRPRDAGVACRPRIPECADAGTVGGLISRRLIGLHSAAAGRPPSCAAAWSASRSSGCS